MEFCPVCQNMYFIKSDKNDKSHLIYWCKNCTKEEKKELKGNNCIYSSKYSSNQTITFSDFINKYTHLDKTLPRVNNIPCPNEDCISHTNKDLKEVIYIKYDATNMKYLYLCCKCKTCWINDIDSISIINI